MIYMTVFWIIMLVGTVYYIARSGDKNEKIKDHAMILLFAAVAFLFVGIVTRDPLFSSFGVPAEFEWIVGVFIAGLTSWRLYFAPLKERVVVNENDVARLEGEIIGVKGEVTGVKGQIKGVQGEIKGIHGEIRSFQRELSIIRDDLHIIKEKLIG